MDRGVSAYIRHVTLTTGHARDSFPGEVDPDVLEQCRTLIAECLDDTNATHPIPGPTGYSLSAEATTRCLTAVVWADGPPSESIATIGVATHSRCGASLWRHLHRWGTAPVTTDPASVPPEPWVAAALEAGIVQHVGAAEWLGDFERCLAWAWLAHVEHGR